MIVLLEPRRPDGYVSGSYRYQDEVMRRLAAERCGRRVEVAPDELEATVHALQATPGTYVVVDGTFLAHTDRPLPAGVTALLHAPPDRDPWCEEAAATIATNAQAATRAQALAQSVAVVRPGIDTCFVPPRHPPANERPRVVCVGTIGAAKGQHLVVEAVADEGICEVVFVGYNASEPEYAAAIREEAEDIPVTFTGPLPPAAVAAELQRADLFVATARDDPFALAAAEAASCRTPVLAFDTGEIASFVRHGETGWLLAPDAEDAVMTQWILDLVTDRDRVARARRLTGPTLTRCWDEVSREFAARVLAAAR